MTAFARKDQAVYQEADKNSDAVINWEIRSVNHRHLEISLSLPESFRAFENKLKEHFRQKLGRGKIDAKLTLSHIKSTEMDEILLNKEKIKALLSARHMLESISKKPVSLSGMDILSWPGVLEKYQDNSGDYFKEIDSALDLTLDELVVTRENEGARLLEMITTRCDHITILVKAVRERRTDVVLAIRDRLLRKLAELDIKADPNRLEQELAFQAQRLDVDEELDRIDSHIEEVNDVLKRDEPIGRRLDFLMQELHREANTLASKSNDAETTRSAVDLKVLIEQMREQALNIE